MDNVTLEWLYENFQFMEQRITDLDAEVKKLKEKKRKKEWAETKSKITLEDVKDQFVKSKPKERTDPFDSTELALWGLYVQKGREICTSFPELKKREKTAQKVVEYFIGLNNSEQTARSMAKIYLEYVLVNFKTFRTGKGEEQMNFWVACSDYALSHYSSTMNIWNVLKTVPDVEPK